MRNPRVVVVGGSGFYGRYVVADVLRHKDVEVTVVARHPHGGFGTDRVRLAVADHRNIDRLCGILDGANAVIHCAGPFQAIGSSGHPLGPLRAALAAGVSYVDISEDRAFRRAAIELATSATVPVLTGASVVPGLQALMLADLAGDLDRVTKIVCAAAPDTRRHRGPAMFTAMLDGAGRKFTAPRDGRPTEIPGWSEPEWVCFPPPIGRRLVYQVYEMADLDVLAELFGAGTVAFKAGTEFSALNRVLGAVAAIRARTGRPRRLHRWTPLVRGVSWLAGRMGDESGGFMVSVTGERAGREVHKRLGITAHRHGGRIPALLAGIAVERLLVGDLNYSGIVPLHSWLRPAALYRALADRGVRIWTDKPG